MIQTDCLHYIGDVPCIFHKKYRIECNENCQYYKKIGLRILIIKKDAIGDVLRTTPILYSIKKKYGENTQITWITNPNAYNLLEFNPLINKIYKFDFKRIIHLEFEKFDILYNLDKDRAALGLAKKIESKKKFGFSMNKFGNLTIFNESGEYALHLGISDNLKEVNTKTYQEIICELLELPYSKEFKYILQIPELEKLRNKLLKKHKINNKNKVIGFNTGAGAKFLTKMWPKEYFVELGVKLIKKLKFTILLFGSDSEKDINDFIYKEIKFSLPDGLKSNIINTGTENTLLEFAALISLTNLLITGDTLALHLAISLNVHSISLFGPTSSNEIDLYDTGIKIIAKSDCLLCYRVKCNYSPFCMSLIRPDFIHKKVLEIFNYE